MSLSLILAACSPAAPTTPASPAAPAAPTPAAPSSPSAPAVEKAQQEASPAPNKPQYGGTINLLQTTDILYFDPIIGTPVTYQLTNEHLTEGDWSKGPAGTGETNFFYAVNPREVTKGQLAESWQIPAIGTIVYQIRRGVRYSVNPASEASRLVNGREFTADDAVFSINRSIGTVTSPTYRGAPEMAKSANATKTGAWEVTIKTPVDPWWGYIAFFSGWSFRTQVPEVVQKYGNAQDWRNSVGTGPYMLKEFVPSSTATLVRNPNYWDKNNIGPGKDDQLPYVDTVRYVIIPDISTQVAAIRTARVDWGTLFTAEDARNLTRANPKLVSSRRIGGSQASIVIAMRTDKQDLPFKDRRVRQALTMGTDFESLKNDYYIGDAQVPAWPFADTEDVHAAYLPLEQQSPAVQELYKYNPTKAKQLLTEAGFPNGFKTKVITQSVTTWVDPMSAVKAMWAKIGVDVEIQPKELGVYNTITQTRTFDEMQMKQAVGGMANIATMSSYRGETHWNASFVKDDKAEQLFQEMQKNIIINQPKVLQMYKEFLPYLLEQAYVIPLPLPYIYTLWWPWVENYHGETSISFSGGNSWVKYVWIDQALKKSMGY